MIKEVKLNFSSKNLNFNISSDDAIFEFSSSDNLSYTQVQISIYNAPSGFFHWLKPVATKGDPYNNKNLIFITATAFYSTGENKVIFSNSIENVYQQIHTPPDTVLVIKTCSILMSEWNNRPLQKPLVIKNSSFKTTCQQALGSSLGKFNIKDFNISGTFYRKMDVVQDFQIDGLKVRYNLSYENNKVNITHATQGQVLALTQDNGLRSNPTITDSDASYIQEYFMEQTYYQLQFNTVFGILSAGQNVQVKDYRGLRRTGFIKVITRSFHSYNGGFDSVVLQEGLLS